MEHRTPKAWYTRTSRKDFVKQMSQIERRQAWICRIKEHIYKDRSRSDVNEDIDEDIACSPASHHNIGKSQKYPQCIGLFLQKHAGDPAVKVMDVMYAGCLSGQ